MEKNGDTIYSAEPCQVKRSSYALFTRKGNTLYMHVHFWPGDYVAISGLKAQVKSARLHAGGKAVKFDQDRFRTRFTGLPASAPDDPVTTIAIECDSEPVQDTMMVRKERPRRGVGV
jgi:alpha-L-fucosidase